MKHFILGKKIGMTQFFYKNGDTIPVTLIYIKPTLIIKKNYKKDFVVIKMCFIKKGKKNIYILKVKQKNFLKKSIGISMLSINQYIDITSISIGKGYSGVIKKYGFKGLEASHGVSKKHRSQGSTGQCQDPGKVFKGKKMAGHLGNKKATIQNLKIVDINKNLNIIAIKGSIAGHKGRLVYIKKAIKKYIK